MNAMAVQTREDKRRHIGWEHVEGGPLVRRATAAPMDPTPSLAEEHPPKKRHTQRIGHGISEAETVY